MIIEYPTSYSTAVLDVPAPTTATMSYQFHIELVPIAWTLWGTFTSEILSIELLIGRQVIILFPWPADCDHTSCLSGVESDQWVVLSI